MNTVKDICDGMLAAPPPAPDSATVLAAARRSADRRRYATVAAGSALALTAAAALIAVPALNESPVPAEVAAPPSVTAPAASHTAPKVMSTPPAKGSYRHGAAMRERLRGIAPAGYTITDFPTSRDSSLGEDDVLPDATRTVPAAGALNVSFGGLILRQGGREGMVTAAIWATGRPQPLCPPAPEPGTTCDVRTVGGVEVAVQAWTDDAGAHVSATRPLQGGMLMVTASQGSGGGSGGSATLDGFAPSGSGKPPLATLPFTGAQLAALAADPAMLQFPA